MWSILCNTFKTACLLGFLSYYGQKDFLGAHANIIIRNDINDTEHNKKCGFVGLFPLFFEITGGSYTAGTRILCLVIVSSSLCPQLGSPTSSYSPHEITRWERFPCRNLPPCLLIKHSRLVFCLTPY